MKDKRARIFYNWWGNANINNRMWCILEYNGDVLDFGSKEHCIKVAEEEGLKYQVERWHKKERGKITIIKKN